MLREASTTRSLIRKRRANFLSHMMRREKLDLEYLVTIQTIEGNRCRRIRREKMLDGLIKWLKVGRVAEALKAMEMPRRS